MSYSDALKGKTQNMLCSSTIHPPHSEFDEEMSDNCCAICFETLDENCNKATIDCGHSFHYKCIFRWNTKSSGGEACPLCRKNQDLPEQVYSSSEEEESDFEIEIELNDSDDSDDSENENSRTIRNEMIRCRQKRALQFFLKTNKDTESTISLNCKTCKTDIIDCDFCSNLICSCENTQNKITNNANPFGKLFNCTNNPNEYDEEFYNLFDIDSSGLDVSELRICHTCIGCFKSRDYILWASLIHLDENYESTHTINPDIFDDTDIKTIYYNLYSDRSKKDNSSLYTLSPKYSTYESFKDYVNQKFNNRNISEIVNQTIED